MSLPVTVVALNLGDIFHYFFDGAGVDTHCRRVIVADTPLVLSAPKTSLLVVLILFRVGGGSLLSGRWLFSTR